MNKNVYSRMYMVCKLKKKVFLVFYKFLKNNNSKNINIKKFKGYIVFLSNNIKLWYMLLIMFFFIFNVIKLLRIFLYLV